MKTKQIFAASSLILAVGMAQPASAALSFGFSPTGNSVYTVTADTIDQAPGSALAIQGVLAFQGISTGINLPGTSTPCPTCFILDYQANLSALLSNGTPTYAPIAPNPNFNFTVQLIENTTPTGTGSANFTTLGGTFSMFAGAGNNLTGAGFGAGTAILTASVDLTGTQTSSFSTTSTTAVPIDSFSTAGQTAWTNAGMPNTVVGSGATKFALSNIWADSAYFSGLDAASILSFIADFNTSQLVPFNEVDPSLHFVWDGTGVDSNVGATNGLGSPAGGPDFIFQADANMSLNGTPIPEPEALFLLGLGVAGFYLSRKRVQA